MTTFHNDIIGAIRITSLHSARFPHDTLHWAIHAWPVHYLGVHLYRNIWVLSNHYDICSKFHYERSSIDTGGATNLEPQICTSVSPTFPYDDTLISPSSLKLNHLYKSSNKTFLKPLVWKRGPIGEWDLPLELYRCLSLSIAHLTTTCSCKVTNIIWKDKLMQL
jgi:hypothetical protein